MFKRISVLVLSAVALSSAAPLLAADDAMPAQDLKATIALNGKTCDQIVEVKRNGDSDYTASCKDGNRYRVYVSAEGRVVVEKL
jgi:uncharacterized protein YfaS (alpha-2-macroglobulin family)